MFSPFFPLKLVLRHGNFGASKMPLVFLYLLRLWLLAPFAVLERLFLSKKIRETPLRAAPVFILGHQRSGTTLLHKLLARDPQFGVLDTYDVLFPYSSRWQKKWLKPLLQRALDRVRARNPHFNDYPVLLDDPLEEEFFTLGLGSKYSAYWGDAFPGRRDHFTRTAIAFQPPGAAATWAKELEYLVKKFARMCDGERFLSKNPPHTGRVGALLKQFPEAKFIYLYRNPYQVFYSTFFQWKRTIQRYYALQQTNNADLEALVFRYYRQLLEAYEAQKCLIPAGNLVELRYEELKADPLSCIEQIYAKLHLKWSNAAQQGMRDLLRAERHYENYRYDYDPALLERIRAQWGEFIARWGYAPP